MSTRQEQTGQIVPSICNPQIEGLLGDVNRVGQTSLMLQNRARGKSTIQDRREQAPAKYVKQKLPFSKSHNETDLLDRGRHYT